MNRIVLIGNGFDLAHGLKTSYKHFIDDYWSMKIDQMRLKYNDIYEDEDFYIKKVFPFSPDMKTIYEYLEMTRGRSNHRFKNEFLRTITLKRNLNNWVDIEREYYDQLKLIVKDNGIIDNDKGIVVTKLNKDFQRIKIHLINYLAKIENSTKVLINSNIKFNFGCTIFPHEVNQKGSQHFAELIFNERKEQNISEINPKLLAKIGDTTIKDISFIQKNLEKYFRNSHNAFEVNEVIALSFNYTTTDDLYLTKQYKSIRIHGELYRRNDNPIIFGYGDEIDDDYKLIENLNENKFLENVKSIKYLETYNYRKLIDFVNDDVYQVVVMGHSCGISDRTLLNTLFEHDNCVSIKPYYHAKEDGSDNYEEIVMNISRNFKDKVKMRDRVVNKQYCEPLT